MTAANGSEAVANARRFTRYDVGMCLKFIRGEAWEIGSLYGSAIDAWHGALYRPPGDRNPPLGAPMFYDSPSSEYGHIVINTGPGDIRSTDCKSAGNVSEAGTDWPVQNFGQSYLGWTEDLNGIRLPLGDDEMNDEDWKKLRGIVADEVQKNNNELAERVWTDQMKVTTPADNVENKQTRQVIREIWQRIAKAT